MTLLPSFCNFKKKLWIIRDCSLFPISGYTRFINNTEIEHSRYIIQELLEVLVNSNNIDLKISEIEGYAILFYSFGKIPSLEMIYREVETMFCNFHKYLNFSPGPLRTIAGRFRRRGHQAGAAESRRSNARWGRERPYGKSLWWPVVARNKKSVTLNLPRKGRPEDRPQADRAFRHPDREFRPGTLERWNMSYEQLSKETPSCILVRVTGYGQTGPYDNGRALARSAKLWAACVTWSAIPPRRRAGWAFQSVTSLAATFAALGAMMAVHARTTPGAGKLSTARSTRPCWR